MLVQFEFATTYASLLGEKRSQVKLEGDQASLDEAVAALMEKYPQWEVILRKNNFYKEDKLDAMYICDQSILTGESKLKDGALIRIHSPICGG